LRKLDLEFFAESGFCYSLTSNSTHNG
jgi:hypothetical protein